MPVHPAEEEAPSGLTDKVAQESKDSTASNHPLHDENKGPVKATASDHKSKGPAISDGMYQTSQGKVSDGLTRS